MANVRQDEVLTRACKCLNIRIQSKPPQGTPPDFLKDCVADSPYTLTYVGQDGLSVAHPQVTMRTRKMGLPLVDTNRCVRYTTLTCLLCQTLVYRVQQLVPQDVEGQEGPLLPTHDWVEQDVLMSSSGWIEVHSNCLDSDDVSRLMSSTTYSPIFNVAVPLGAHADPVLSTQPSYIASIDASHHEIPPQPILSNLRSLFPPAPFIPSHPVFSHLSSIALSKSQALRSSAEEQLAALIRDKVAEIEKSEEELKRVVEGLWRRFLESLGETEKDWGPSDAAKRRDPARKLSINTAGGQIVGTPVVSVRDFVPVSSPVRIASPASSMPRVSSLSASLATSTFHHPRTLRERVTHTEQVRDIPRSPPPYSSHPSSVGSADSTSLPSSTSSGALLALANGDSLIQPFKRSMDEARDTAASFRYFIDMEAEMEMMRGRQRLSTAKTTPEIKEETHSATEGTKPSNTPGPALENVPKEAKGDRLQKSDHDKNGNESRAKRKVTFDIKPVLATDGSARKMGNGQGRDVPDMIFDLEGESSDRDSSDAAPVLPFKEAPHIPRRRIRPRSSTGQGGLPASLSTLRPASLPAYASLQVQADITKEESTLRTNSPPPGPLDTERNRRIAGPGYPEAIDPQEEEILKLVAADTPSHRGAWKPNSRAWQLFVSRQGGKNGVPGAFIPEEVEVDGTVSDTDDSDDVTAARYDPPGIPASLPISIEPLSRTREPLSLGSYQPKTSLSDHAGIIVPRLPKTGDVRSASVLRKASYAARDRDRSMDPGTLDFVSQVDEEGQDEESDEEPSQADPLDEARGRRRALKILEARNRLPAAGMWRSLA